MTGIKRRILEQLIAGTAEPLLLVRVDQPDWPVVLANPAFSAISEETTLERPFADVVEALAGREFALEVSEAVRSTQELSLPVEVSGREFLLVLRPLEFDGANGDGNGVSHYAAYWRSGGGVGSADSEAMHHALLKAKRRIRDLSRDDPVTGLLNGREFGEIFEHDWAVAAREKSQLAIVKFELDEFDAYLEVFGRHAADSCLRRVGQAIRRCLRRASDVVARPAGACLIVLSHASDEEGVQEFAGRISIAVRELGLHHPRASSSKFVSVNYDVVMVEPGNETVESSKFLSDLFAVEAE
ncbi:MAG: diguanylate cyclase [Pseudomonadota bacterium]